MFKTKVEAENAANEILKGLSNQWSVEVFGIERIIDLNSREKEKQYRYILINTELNLTIEETSNVYFVIANDENFDRTIFDNLKGEKTVQLAIENFKVKLIEHANKTLKLAENL